MYMDERTKVDHCIINKHTNTCLRANTASSMLFCKVVYVYVNNVRGLYYVQHVILFVASMAVYIFNTIIKDRTCLNLLFYFNETA